jgi:hypothetical protein
MVQIGSQKLCDNLRRIVSFLEQKDSGSAAALVAEMQELLPSLPPSLPDDEIAEVRRLLDRFAVLGEELRRQIETARNRLGAARRLRAYGRHGRRP